MNQNIILKNLDLIFYYKTTNVIWFPQDLCEKLPSAVGDVYMHTLLLGFKIDSLPHLSSLTDAAKPFFTFTDEHCYLLFPHLVAQSNKLWQ